MCAKVTKSFAEIMVWTLLALLCVLATKFLTAVRLRGLKGKLGAAQPHLDELRHEVVTVEEEVEELRLTVSKQAELLNAIQDAVLGLEDSLKQPSQDLAALERVQLMQTVASQG
jgi:chromosome segregation ATPase